MPTDVWEQNDEAEDTRQSRYLVAQIGGEAYGIPIGCVTEITGRQPVLAAESLPGFLLGRMEARGGYVPVADMRQRLGLAGGEYGEKACVVIVNAGGITLGLLAEDVSSVVELDDAAVMAPPAFMIGAGAGCVSGVAKYDGRFLLLLDCALLLRPEEEEALRALV